VQADASLMPFSIISFSKNNLGRMSNLIYLCCLVSVVVYVKATQSTINKPLKRGKEWTFKNLIRQSITDEFTFNLRMAYITYNVAGSFLCESFRGRHTDQ
jgi:hypothetical protein